MQRLSLSGQRSSLCARLQNNELTKSLKLQDDDKAGSPCSVPSKGLLMEGWRWINVLTKVKHKLFGATTFDSTVWTPHTAQCKLYNYPNPSPIMAAFLVSAECYLTKQCFRSKALFDSTHWTSVHWTLCKCTTVQLYHAFVALLVLQSVI